MIKMILEEEATGKVKDIYDEINEHLGLVPNLFKAMAADDVEWLEENWQREKQIMLEDGPLDPKYRELIAFVVSEVNNCQYCSIAHESMARNRGLTDEEVAHARKIIKLFSSFNAIANSFVGLHCEFADDE